MVEINANVFIRYPTVDDNARLVYFRKRISGTITIPLSISASIQAGTPSSANVSIPAVGLVSTCSSKNEFAIPGIALVASCHADYGIRASRSLPGVT